MQSRDHHPRRQAIRSGARASRPTQHVAGRRQLALTVPMLVGLVAALAAVAGVWAMVGAGRGTQAPIDGSAPPAAATTPDVQSDAELPVAPDASAPDAQEHLRRWLDAGENRTLLLRLGDGRVTLGRDRAAALLARRGDPATVTVDAAALRALAADVARELDQVGQDARFAWEGGAMRVLRESRERRVVDQGGAARAIAAALLAGETEVALPGTVVPPAVSSANPKALGIEGVLERGSTPIGGASPEKRHNVRLAAERLHGVVVPPGGTFSFNREVGPTTLAAGFRWGFGIASADDGVRTVPSVAGGICQVATTLFQPVFWAGFPVGTRYSHLYWIRSYASRGVVGLDVTVDEEAGLDFTWVNPTDGYILVQSAVDDDAVYFGLYGKKLSWDVRVSPPEVTNPRPADPEPIARPEPQLAWGRVLQVESATDGFDVAVTRTVDRKDGRGPQPLTLRTSYQPARTVTLVGTAGMPAGADLEGTLARIAPSKSPTVDPSPGIVTGSPSPTGSPQRPAMEPTAEGRPAEATRPATATPVPATPAPRATTPPATQAPTAATTPPAATGTPRAAATPTAGATGTTAPTRPPTMAAPTTVATAPTAPAR